MTTPIPSLVNPSLFHIVHPIQTVSWKVTWTKADIDNALNQHDLGLFMSSGLLLDIMLRDDTLAAVTQKRILRLLKSDLILNNSELDKDGKFVNWLYDNIELFFPKHALSKLLLYGIFIGVGVAQVIWHHSDGVWYPDLQVFHPSHLTYRYYEEKFFVNTRDAGTVPVQEGVGNWVLHTPNGKVRGWLDGAIRSLAVPWLARQYAWTDWQKWSESYSMGIRKAVCPASSDEDVKARFYNQIANLGSETTVLLEQSASEGSYDKFDIDVLWPNSSNAAEGYLALMSKCESRYAIRLLGNNLTTEIGATGSYAASQTHDDAELSIIKGDAKSLGETLYRDVLRPFCLFHFGNPKWAPRISWEIEPNEDKKLLADTWFSLANAIEKLTTLGLPIDKKQMLLDNGVPVLPEINKDPSLLETKEPRSVMDSADATPDITSPSIGPKTIHASRNEQLIPESVVIKNEHEQDAIDTAIAGHKQIDKISELTISNINQLVKNETNDLSNIINNSNSLTDMKYNLINFYKKIDTKPVAEQLIESAQLAKLVGFNNIAQHKHGRK